jgi:Cytochrome oxidase c assembly
MLVKSYALARLFRDSGRVGMPPSRALVSAFENPPPQPQLMVRTRLSAADILHRGVVLSLIGVCVWGIGTGILVHRDTLRMGRGTHIPHVFAFSGGF